MAPHRAKPHTRKAKRQPSLSNDQGKRPRGIKKARPQLSCRKGGCSSDIEHHYRPTICKDRNTEPEHPLPSSTSNTPGKELPLAGRRKRKRSQEDDTLFPLPISSQKRPRTSTPRSSIKDTTAENSVVKSNSKEINGIEYWRKVFKWPKEYFEPENAMNHLLARKKSSSSLRGKQSEADSATPSSITPNDQKPREAKSTPYTRPSYETVLETKGSFMGKFDLGITDASKRLCRTLLEAEQLVPQDTLFRDDLFDETCESVRARNEAMVVRDISPLICPPAQVLRIYGAKHLRLLNESVNEGWNSAIPFYGPRPQPDYSAGFGRSAFTNDQLEKLIPFVGEMTDTFTSYFMATWQMYFPFLTCEVKCGAAALDVADRQNAHSMTIAVRGIVELFRLVKREKELHQEILSFSISHDHRNVRIYGHYPIIDGKNTTFYRHPIRTFDFTELDGREKWTAYKFTKNVYDIWMPMHFKRICSVVDLIPPDISFDVLQQSEPAESRLSQGLESHHLSEQSSQDAVSLLDDAYSQPSRAASSRDVTPDTSLSQRRPGSFIKPKKRRRPVELHQGTTGEGEYSPETLLEKEDVR